VGKASRTLCTTTSPVSVPPILELTFDFLLAPIAQVLIGREKNSVRNWFHQSRFSRGVHTRYWLTVLG